MEKGAIKRFATGARRKLLENVAQKAFELGITKQHNKDADVYKDGFLINGQFYHQNEIRQRERLITEIEQKGYDAVIDEVAYTWFNRLIALRYMEVNDYLPSGIRMFSSLEPDKQLPDALSEVMLLMDDLDLNEDKVYELQDKNDDEALFKYILIKQCNQLGEWMPVMFEEIADYTELLLPGSLLSDTSVIRDMVTMIDEAAWTEEVEIIGWLYQYYIAEKKDEVFTGLQKNEKITKENIPAATELFTPRWIVQYMVDNSLGRLWVESHDEADFQLNLPYYLEAAEQPEQVQEQLQTLMDPDMDPKTITFLDPCMGSGHILVYAFEVFYKIYQSQGYREQDIPYLILEHNLYGLDIDPRAGQLSYFAVLMKAMQYNQRLFERPIHTHLHWIEESNTLTDEDIETFAGDSALKNDVELLLQTFEDAQLYGSALTMPNLDLAGLKGRLSDLETGEQQDMFSIAFKEEKYDLFKHLIAQAELLAGAYDVVVTNPPYMWHQDMNVELKSYLRKNYKDSSDDLYAVFMEVTSGLVVENGFIGQINQHSWMFLSSYESLRKKILKSYQVYSMAHLGARAFSEIGGEVVQTTTFVMRKKVVPDYLVTFARLVDVNNAEEKGEQFFNKNLRYERTQHGFSDIPGSPISYWANQKHYGIYEKSFLLGSLSEVRKGLATGNTELFIKYWHEVELSNIALFNNRNENKKWYLCHKGGKYRKWYGGLDKVIYWENGGYRIKNYKDDNGRLKSRPQNLNYMFKKGITFSKISSLGPSCRIMTGNEMFDDAVQGIFMNDSKVDDYYLLGILNSPIVAKFLQILNPTLNKQINDLKRIPILITQNKNKIYKQLNFILNISKSDWDAFETSWDFKTHPFLEFQNDTTKMSDAFANWEQTADDRFRQLQKNEVALNRIFIDLYGLQDELTPDVPDEEVTVNRADRERDVKSFLSYAVGVMFGRYSLDEEGLVFAGGTFNLDQYHTFQPDQENVIPITDDVYFEDDMVTRLITILKLTFGDEHLQANLDFIADTLKKRNGETARQRIRRYFLKEFYKDHVRMYQKRPIYWLFDSGRQDGFKALVYLHRYDPGLAARVRTDYLHAQQRKYEEEIRRQDQVLESDASKPDKTRATKRKEKLQKQLLECQHYDDVIAHVANQGFDLELDDGVKVNYAKFQNIDVPQGEGKQPLIANVLAKI